MLIGILQTGHFLDNADRELGDYDDQFQRMLAGHGFEFRTWNVVDMDFPTSVDEAQGWLITGSKHGAYDDLPFIAPLEDFIRRACAKAVPMVGICFGHQIIAQALGGRVVKFDEGWAVGATEYQWLGEPVTLNAWHQDQVIEKPLRAERVASSAFCENAALLYPGRAFTVQAHPEFDQPAIKSLLKARRGKGVIPEEQLDTVEDRLETKVDNALITQRIVEFFKETVTHG